MKFFFRFMLLLLVLLVSLLLMVHYNTNYVININKNAQSTTALRVAIIGHSGFIGSVLAERMHEAGMKVQGYDIHPVHLEGIRTPVKHIHSRDIPEADLQRHNVVIFLGGLTGRESCDRNADRVVDENVDQVVSVARRMAPSQLLVFASTSAIAEGHVSAPALEDCVVHTHLLDRFSSSMHLREVTLRKLSKTLGDAAPQMLGFRFGTVVGVSPSQRSKFLLSALVKSAFLKGRLTVHHPETSQAILWIEDLSQGIITAMRQRNKAAQFDVFNLQSFNTTMATAANEVASQTGALIHSTDAPLAEDILGFQLDTTKFRKTFGFAFQGTVGSVVRSLVTQADKVALGREISFRKHQGNSHQGGRAWYADRATW